MARQAGEGNRGERNPRAPTKKPSAGPTAEEPEGGGDKGAGGQGREKGKGGGRQGR